MVKNAVNCILEETIPFSVVEVLEKQELTEAAVISNPPLKFNKASLLPGKHQSVTFQVVELTNRSK
jgi:hypothetical protein